MEHGVPGAGGKGFVHCRRIRQVGDDQARAGRHGGTVALAEAVQHDHLRPLIGQQGDEVAADVAGAASDQVT